MGGDIYCWYLCTQTLHKMIHEKKCLDETEELLQIYDNNVRKEETKASDIQMDMLKFRCRG